MKRGVKAIVERKFRDDRNSFSHLSRRKIGDHARYRDCEVM